MDLSRQRKTADDRIKVMPLKLIFSTFFPCYTQPIFRFILTRIWFTISLPPNDKSSKSSSLDFKVLDAKEIVPNEIWTITIQTSNKPHSSRETFYVLEPTCEIIGHPQTHMVSHYLFLKKSLYLYTARISRGR